LQQEKSRIALHFKDNNSETGRKASGHDVFFLVQSALLSKITRQTLSQLYFRFQLGKIYEV